MNCPHSPRKLVSLWDIVIEFKADEVARALVGLGRYREASESAIRFCGSKSEPTEEERETLSNFLLSEVIPVCDHLKLPDLRSHTGIFLNQLFENTVHPHISHLAVKQHLGEIEAVLLARVNANKCALISPDKCEFFERERLFGDAVYDRFEKARYDIKEAGNCFAAGANTAAIFHLMRAVEFGLRALATDLKVKAVRKTKARIPIDFATWDEIIRAIESKTTQLMTKTRGPRRQADLDFYNEMLGEMKRFKDYWRNSVMHARAIYDEHQAMSAMIHVRAFMQTLATRVKQS